MSTDVQTAPKTNLMEGGNSQIRRRNDRLPNRRNTLVTSCAGTAPLGAPNETATGAAQQHKKNKHDYKPNRKRLQNFNGSSGKFFPPYKRRKKDGIVPPTKFLLGGNICDPLNLNSLQDEEINRAMNAVTPKSSPLPTPTHRRGQIEVIIPPNIYDPLNLATCDDDAEYEAMLISPIKRSQKKRKKRKHTKSFSGQGSGKEDTADEARLSGDEKKFSEGEEQATSHDNADKSASSVTELIVNTSAEGTDNEALNVTTTVTESSANAGVNIAGDVSDDIGADTASAPIATKTEDIAMSCQPENEDKSRNAIICALNLDLDLASACKLASLLSPPMKDKPQDISGGNGTIIVRKVRKELKDKIVSPVIPQPGQWSDPRNHRYRVQPQRMTPQINKAQATPKFKENNARFQYGNYNRYYGYRNANEDCDVRFKVLMRRRDLFEGKDVLDVGCNVGHVTLAIARDLGPKKIVGIDIDRSLIDAAKKNVRHYVNPTDKNYPASMLVLYGPIGVPLMSKTDRDKFPNNISFVQGNYVLESDVLLTMEQPQFDTILCLSVTKWFHLNWGDDGLKRAFKRMYAQLRPGGILILEPQPWHSYKKKRNLTPQIWGNYKNIELFPHKFSQYLLSEVGFTKCETIGAPMHQARGFQRPVKVFTKGEITQSNPPSSRLVDETASHSVSEFKVEKICADFDLDRRRDDVEGTVSGQSGDVDVSGNVEKVERRSDDKTDDTKGGESQ